MLQWDEHDLLSIAGMKRTQKLTQQQLLEFSTHTIEFYQGGLRDTSSVSAPRALQEGCHVCHQELQLGTNQQQAEVIPSASSSAHSLRASDGISLANAARHFLFVSVFTVCIVRKSDKCLQPLTKVQTDL